jgi:3',5'-cyclic AMP phosphodiesterase CpdA
VPTRLLHISDLHVGSREALVVERALETLIARIEPELIVASGDLTHRGKAAQHELATAFLRSLGPPVLAIPGNHDIPYSFPARFTRTFAEFERRWETTEPVHRSDALFVVGLNSVRAWRHQSGGIREEQLRRAAELLAEAPDGALRVVTLHHHLIGAPWRSRKKPVSRRSHVLASLVDAGAELILAGHIHQAAVAERHEFEVVAGELRGAVVSVAPGLGQPRPKRRGEARGLHVYVCEQDEIRIETYVWRDDDWGLTAVRRFPRGREPLAVEPVPEAATERLPARETPGTG